jgi:hypothetical protein
MTPAVRLPTTSALPAILSLCRRDRLPLQVLDCIWASARERNDVIFDIAGAPSAARSGRRAGLLALKFAGDFSGSVFFG